MAKRKRYSAEFKAKVALSAAQSRSKQKLRFCQTKPWLVPNSGTCYGRVCELSPDGHCEYSGNSIKARSNL